MGTSKHKVNGKVNHSLDSLFPTSTSKSNLDADWNALNPQVVIRVIWAISTLGGTVQFSCTKNGNAYKVSVYIGKPYDPIYFDGNDEGRAAFAEWADSLVEHAANVL